MIIPCYWFDVEIAILSRHRTPGAIRRAVAETKRTQGPLQAIRLYRALMLKKYPKLGHPTLADSKAFVDSLED